MQLPTYYKVLTLVLSITLVGCGFKLRGSQQFSAELHHLYISATNNSRHIQNELIRTLQARGAILAKTSAQASLTLELLNSQLRQNITNLSPDAQLRNYLISYSLTYQVLDQTGRTILPPQTITITRNYTLSNNQILSENDNSSRLRQNLYYDVINQLLERLNAAQLNNRLTHNHAT